MRCTSESTPTASTTWCELHLDLVKLDSVGRRVPTQLSAPALQRQRLLALSSEASTGLDWIAFDLLSPTVAAELKRSHG